jgi:hypothetical protein
MTFQAYSFPEKKKVNIVSHLKLKDYLLPNGNTVVIASGKSKKGHFIASIVLNSKATTCADAKKSSTKKSSTKKSSTKKSSTKKSLKKAPAGSMCA